MLAFRACLLKKCVLCWLFFRCVCFSAAWSFSDRFGVWLVSSRSATLTSGFVSCQSNVRLKFTGSHPCNNRSGKVSKARKQTLNVRDRVMVDRHTALVLSVTLRLTLVEGTAYTHTTRSSDGCSVTLCVCPGDDFYGSTLRMLLAGFQRREKKFASFPELVATINKVKNRHERAKYRPFLS